MSHRRYTKEYRQEACRLVTREGYGVVDAAKSLGIPPATLKYWLRPPGPADQPASTSGDPPGRGDAAADDPKVLAIQVRELQAKVRRLELEKEILKKATAFFANLQP
jgi:transposase